MPRVNLIELDQGYKCFLTTSIYSRKEGLKVFLKTRSEYLETQLHLFLDV